jgi:hypothetical protein
MIGGLEGLEGAEGQVGGGCSNAKVRQDSNIAPEWPSATTETIAEERRSSLSRKVEMMC